MNRGTVNMAEIMAYFQPLNWYAAEIDKIRHTGTGCTKSYRVHIITDSDYVRKQGSSGNLMPNRHGSLWRVFEDFQRQGIVLTWHWIPREDVLLNKYVDAVSKVARLKRESYSMQELVEAHNSVYAFNPSSNEL